MLGAKPMDHVVMTRAYEELGMIPLKVLLVRRNLAWAARSSTKMSPGYAGS